MDIPRRIKFCPKMSFAPFGKPDTDCMCWREDNYYKPYDKPCDAIECAVIPVKNIEEAREQINKAVKRNEEGNPCAVNNILLDVLYLLKDGK